MLNMLEDRRLAPTDVFKKTLNNYRKLFKRIPLLALSRLHAGAQIDLLESTGQDAGERQKLGIRNPSLTLTAQTRKTQ